MKKNCILFIILTIFFTPHILFADEGNFQIIRPGMVFYGLGLNTDGEMIYKEEIILKGEFDETKFVPFTELGVYKPYNGTIFFYTSGFGGRGRIMVFLI